MIRLGLFIAGFCFLVAVAAPAHAACTGPAGNAGKIIYNETQKTFEYCNNVAWIAMNPAGSGSGGCATPTLDEGKMVYNEDFRVLQGCAGNVHRAMGPVGGGAGWKILSKGNRHTCAIKSDDTLWCWGSNFNGQLGDAGVTAAATTTPHLVSGNTTWRTVSAGASHTCAIKMDNTLWCWGDNSNGRLGDNSTTQRLIPTAVNGGGSWKYVSAGYGHSCGIKTDDTLWCWGKNGNGQLGDNSITQRLIPTAINGGGTWKFVTAGLNSFYGHSCGIKTDDTLWCWGANGNGELGDNTTTQRLIPTAINGGGTWKSVGAGDYHSCGLRTDDTIHCWGQGTYGQVGDNATTQRNVPTALSGGGTWVALDVGGYHTCAVKTGNTMFCWGTNYYAQIGDNTKTQRNLPTAISGGGSWKSVSAAEYGTCGLRTDDTIHCWGSNFNGDLGNDSGPYTGRPSLVTGGHIFKDIASGGGSYYYESHVCAIRSDDALYCWGNNQDGQLGIGAISSGYNVPVPVAGGGAWQAISGSTYHSCGIKTDGSLWCWGSNVYGQLGDNSTTPRSSPTAINGGGTWKSVGAGFSHSCGLKSDDTIWCWGYNLDSELGDGTTTQRLVPTAISGGGTWKYLEVGQFTSCGIKSDDSLWCWGGNFYGELGDGTTFSRNVPTAVSGGGTWKTVSSSEENTCGIKTDNTAWCWGTNWGGQLGDSTTTVSLVPVAVSGGSGWNSISSGTAFTCGIKSDRSLNCWGANYDYQLGLGDTNDRLVPTIVSGGIWDKVSAGDVGGCAISKGQAWCWGYDNSGELGDGKSSFSTTAQETHCGSPAGKAGALLYNSEFSAMQYCDGAGWVAIAGSAPADDLCDGSPAAGTACTNGSLYAGLSPDGNVKMFTTPADAGTYPWDDASIGGKVVTGITNNVTGEVNTGSLILIDSDSSTGGTQPHQAAQYCADLNAHGQTDWYLPARDELSVLYTNRVAIGGFSTDYYWSSTENVNISARVVWYTDGSLDTSAKEDLRNVRCVRK